MSDTVSLVLPGGPSWAHVAELVLAGLGARLDLPYDRIDEVQLAVSSILRDTSGAAVQVEAEAGAETLEVRVSPLASGVATDPARRLVLDALADGVELDQRDGGLGVVLTFARGEAR